MNVYVNVKCIDCGTTFQVSDTTEFRHRNDPEYQYRCPTCKVEFNKKTKEAKDNEPVTITCIKCGNTFTLRRKIYSNRVWKKARLICDDCLRKENAERGKAQYAKMSPEERNIWSQRTKDQLAKRSPEEWANVKAKTKATREKQSAEEKASYRVRFQEKWNSLTPEEQAKRLAPMQKGAKEYRESMTDDEKTIQMERLFAGRANYYANLSKEEYDARCERLQESAHNYWKNITAEQYERYQTNRREGILRYQESLGDAAFSSTEITFMQYLVKYGITYLPRWVNQYKHPDFDKLFPYNPVTGSKYVDFHHIWDIAVITKNRDILVDVDGSCHKDSEMNYCLPGRNFTEHDHIQFNDSKRPYQTDGFDAYAILAYDDKIDDDTGVKNLISGNIISFSMFLQILKFYDTDPEILRDIFKEDNQ